MGWLEKLSFGRGGAAVAEAEREDADSTPVATSGPPLMVLVNDASGRASFKTHAFPDAESATEWVRYWFPMESEDTLTAFWAMTEQPEVDIDAPAEPLVLIQDNRHEGVVFLFSFVDISSANEFMREEVEHGTPADAMNLYWAVQVRRELDRSGKLTLTPSTPPGVVASALEEETPESDGWVVRETPVVESATSKPAGNARALMEEAPNARTGVADPYSPGQETFELTSWMERARKRPSRPKDVVAIAAEVAAASEKSFEERLVADEVPVVDVEDAVVVEATVPTEPEPVFEETVAVEAVEAVVEAEAKDPEPEPVAVEPTPEVEVEAPESAAPIPTETVAEEESDAPVADKPVVVQDSADAEAQEPTAAVSEAESVKKSEGAPKLRASTNGNGHKSPVAHEVVIEINGHKVGTPSEPIDSGAPSLPGSVHEDTPSLSGHANGNGHMAQVTSPQGEGMPAIERQPERADAEAGAESDQTPDIVHDVRIETARNGGGQEDTISIQIGIHLQSRALRMKRWEVKEEPFEGFKSPPGRF